MSQFIIQGGKKLRGEVEIGGAKNSILKILPAAILCSGKVIVENVPAIEDVKRMKELMEHLGAQCGENGGKKLIIDATHISQRNLHEDIAKRLRASIMLVGPLLAKYGSVTFPHPGGCVIGQRPIDLFLDGFKAFGASIDEDINGAYPVYHIHAKKLKGAEYIFRNISVTGTEALMMTATLIPGKTVLRNAAVEPEIPALADFLNSCGARVRGAGTHTIEIEGVKKLSGGTFRVIPDRIDAGSFAILAAATRSELEIKNIIPEHISNLLMTLKQMGVGVQVRKNSVRIIPSKRLKAVSIKTHEYPGFPTDLQAPFTVLATSAEGQTLIHETVYEGRLFYIESLNRMGAQIIMCDPHRILVHGATKLHGRDMESPDLRAGLAFVIAALTATGTSVINDIYPIERGYEKIEERLRKIGADIKRVD
jgi:UDP-N-acetylglucosamine 1-carboxyvinyltransferase